MGPWKRKNQEEEDPATMNNRDKRRTVEISLDEDCPEAGASASATGAVDASMSSTGAVDASISSTGAVDSSISSTGSVDASISSNSAAEASTAAGLATVTSDAFAGTTNYDAEPSVPEPIDEAAALETQDEKFNDGAAAAKDEAIKTPLEPPREIEYNFVAEDYSEAVEAFTRSSYGLSIIRDYKQDVYMAALDNVLNQHIERRNPGEQRVANIKVIMNRFYQVMRVWIGNNPNE